MTLKERAVKLKKDLPAIYLALKHKETPWFAKALASLTIVYALSPIDIIPDFIPVLGYWDDLIILPLLAAITIKLIPEAIMIECYRTSENLWKSGKPKLWYFGLPIIVIWIGVMYLIIRRLI